MENNLAHISVALDKVGYLKIPLFSQKEVNELKEIIDKITSNLSLPIEKYHVTILSDDKLYKQKIQELLKPIISKKIIEILPDFTVITTNLIIKSPLSGEVPLHQNWTFVNEQKQRSYTIWIPLTDTNELNGTLEFIDGSHNIFCDVKRGHNTPYFFMNDVEKLKKFLKSVSVKFGEALILDDSILHFSKQNKSNKERVAIQATLVPKEAILYHYHYKRTFLKDKLYELIVTPDFYKDMKVKIDTITSVSALKKRIISDADWAKIKEMY